MCDNVGIMSRKTLVLPEQNIDDRVKQAGGLITDQGIADVLDINNLDETQMKQCRDLLSSMKRYSTASSDEIDALMGDELVLGALSVKVGIADGMIAGAVRDTSDVLRAGLRIIGVKKGVKLVSSSFLMKSDTGEDMIFADCAVNPDPDAEGLAQIAADSAVTAQMFGLEPRVAMLSFATGDRAKHPKVDKVVQATALLMQKMPDLLVAGPVQFDAALLPSIASKKGVESFEGKPANVYVFPDLDSGNIGYKIAQRLGGLEAIGPILQGFAKPINDLSRGCSVDDIVSLAEITVSQTEQ